MLNPIPHILGQSNNLAATPHHLVARLLFQKRTFAARPEMLCFLLYIMSDKGEPQFKRVKHTAPKAGTGARVVWVSRRSRQAHLIKRLSALLDKSEPVRVNALGAAVVPAVNLALELNRRWNNGLLLEFTTDTVELSDELQPLADDADVRMETRLNSAIHIVIQRKK